MITEDHCNEQECNENSIVQKYRYREKGNDGKVRVQGCCWDYVSIVFRLFVRRVALSSCLGVYIVIVFDGCIFLDSSILSMHSLSKNAYFRWQPI